MRGGGGGGGGGVLFMLFMFLNKNIHCDPSLKPSQQDRSNKGSQSMFLWSNKGNYPKLSLLPFPSSGPLKYKICHHELAQILHAFCIVTSDSKSSQWGIVIFYTCIRTEGIRKFIIIYTQ